MTAAGEIESRLSHFPMSLVLFLCISALGLVPSARVKSLSFDVGDSCRPKAGAEISDLPAPDQPVKPECLARLYGADLTDLGTQVRPTLVLNRRVLPGSAFIMWLRQ